MEINNDITFQSKIKFIKQSEFNEKVRRLNKKKHYVGWPWTADTCKTGKNLYTDKDMDCIVVGLKDNNKFRLLHLGIYNQKKAKNNHQKGFDIENAKRRILEGINLENKDLHVFIFGGFNYNEKITEKIKHIFDELKIPYTNFTTRKNVHYYGRYSYFFNNKEDTLYFTNNLTEAEALQWNKDLPRPKEINIVESKGKKIVVFNTYQKTDNGYDFKRNVSDVRGFLESQFKEVNLSKFDTFA